jgi:hypothetical protein
MKVVRLSISLKPDVAKALRQTARRAGRSVSGTLADLLAAGAVTAQPACPKCGRAVKPGPCRECREVTP